MSGSISPVSEVREKTVDLVHKAGETALQVLDQKNRDGLVADGDKVTVSPLASAASAEDLDSLHQLSASFLGQATGADQSSPNGLIPPPNYPEAVTRNFGDVNKYLVNVQVPPEVQAQGQAAVNDYKMKQLSQALHDKIYNADGTYRSNAPFTDADAGQTLYMAAADLSFKQTFAENPRPTDIFLWQNRTDADWIKDSRFKEKWNDSFVQLASSAIMSRKFGDYGWHPLYQDGTENQSSHFQMAMNGTYWLIDKLGPLAGSSAAWAGNIQHEYQGPGPSVQDFLNSQLAISMTSRMYTDSSYSPVNFAQDWGTNIRTGWPYSSPQYNFNIADPALVPILGLPIADVDRSRYPH
ncbi:MAG: hypothetical protein HYU64_04005 [Armatimonadetes bacterium]|nr:hypothetical protein [Armatimonadota bacterium]